MFRVSTTPIIRSTQNCNYSLRYWSYFLCSYLPATVLCTPDDGCGWHPKHVEWTCRIINRLFCGASRWTIINIKCHCLTVFSIYVVYCVEFSAMNSLECQRRTQRGSRQNAALPKIELKKTNVVNKMLSNVLCDSPFSLNEPVKWSEDQNIRI